MLLLSFFCTAREKGPEDAKFSLSGIMPPLAPHNDAAVRLSGLVQAK
jgi:hypothetical protein